MPPRFDDADARQRLQPRLWHFDYVHLRDLRDAVGAVAPDVSGTILDYGCGAMPYRSLFVAAERYLGADFDSNPLAELRVSEEGRLPDVADSSVDAVVSFQVLEHAADPVDYLTECRRVLRPGGRLVLSTHGTWAYHPAPNDYYRWTQEGLERLLRQAGFVTVDGYAVTDGGRGVLQLAQIVVHRSPAPRAARALARLTLNAASALPPWSRGRRRPWQSAELPICLLALAGD